MMNTRDDLGFGTSDLIPKHDLLRPRLQRAVTPPRLRRYMRGLLTPVRSDRQPVLTVLDTVYLPTTLFLTPSQ